MLLSDHKSVLVVVAHQDDAEVLFGGTVARLVEMGARVNYVLCTDGARSGPDVGASDEAVGGTRAREQQAAARVLGVEEVVFLGYRNGSTEPTVELRRDLVREIRRSRPSLVLT
ncbi:MAG: PIG-L family deacetylase, partial [Candidatus Dormibacteraeota bacterium]|nr:PIG-L family deacetylase [Candidatus Dormibacteraeota bacterium]